jgi:hypothetical protein
MSDTKKNPEPVPETKQKKIKKKKPQTLKSKKITCKFIKKDKYNNGIFLVSEDSNQLKNSYKLAKVYYKKLKKIYDTNLPIWIKKKQGFGTLRFKKGEKLLKLKELAIYEIEFKFHQTSNSRNEKFVNLNIINIELISDFDNGLELDLSDNDDGDDTPNESESDSE